MDPYKTMNVNIFIDMAYVCIQFNHVSGCTVSQIPKTIPGKKLRDKYNPNFEVLISKH